MRKFSLLVVAGFLFATITIAQDIRVYKTFGGVRFERDTVALGINQVLQILKENPEAYAEIKKAKTNLNFSSVLGFAGGVLIGLPLGTALAGGDPEWGLAAGGAALILASLPLNKAFQNHTIKALEIYNGHPASRFQSQFHFTGNGVRLVIRF